MLSLLCSVLLLFPAPSLTANSPAAEEPHFQTGNSASNIPFDLLQNLVLVTVRVNKSRPLTFIVDTGADTSVIDAKQAQILGLKPDGTITATGGAGTAEATFTKGVTLRLRGVELLNQTIYVLPLEGLTDIGRRIDGVLGNDVLGKFVVEIDYTRRIINLHERKHYRYSRRGEVIPMTIEDGLAFVRATVTAQGQTPIEGKFEIDSGSTGAIFLNTPFVHGHNLLTTLPGSIQTNVGGVGGTASTVTGRLASLKLGRFELETPITRFSQATQGDYASDKYDGLIGGEILRRFKVIFDYSRRQMVLEANTDFAKPYDVDMSGMELVIDGNEVLVDDVAQNSPASEAGVKGGDILVAVDARRAVKLGLDQLRTMFMQNGKEYVLTLRRDRTSLQTRIKLRRLL
jgi:aspartyl protease/PDZ domain-containing protein